MTWVYTENVTCPVCGADTAHPDLKIHTNQRDFDSVRCGYSYLLGFADDEVTCPECQEILWGGRGEGWVPPAGYA